MYIVFFGLIIMLLFIIHYVKNYQKITEKIDGVETIDGIRYLVCNADVKYVMYKLGCTSYSKYIKETSFEKISESEGIITFGGVNYNINMTGSERDMNIGAAYRVKCMESHGDVIMDIFFEKRDCKWWSPSTKQVGLILNQAYHRFFKELLDVKVIQK